MTKSKPEPIDIVFSFDTTGSMYPCLTQVRRLIKQTVAKLFKDIPNIRIGVIAHGDYCDKDNPYVMKMLDLTQDQRNICRFVENVESTYGGDADECYELVLHEARRMKWSAGKTKVLVMIGDANPHAPSYGRNEKNLDWRNELDLLTEAGIKVYGVQALNYHGSAKFYKEMATRTAGFHLNLNQFSEVVDLVMGVAYKQAGPDKLTEYVDLVTEQGRMTRGLGRIFGTLSGKEVIKSAFKKRSKDSVDPGRFQVMDVDGDVTIADFVHDQGLHFRPGKGFYEFTKSVMVQEKKEVVLVHKKTGDMFSGKKSRKMIGLPYGERGTRSPRKIPEIQDYTAFIQSTSYNRKLLGGTKFLYEVDSSR